MSFLNKEGWIGRIFGTAFLLSLSGCLEQRPQVTTTGACVYDHCEIINHYSQEDLRRKIALEIAKERIKNHDKAS